MVFGMEYFSRPTFSMAKVNYGTLVVFSSLSVVISATAASRRRLETLLHSMNAELDARVRQQTVALEKANATLQDRLAEVETLYGKLSIGLCFLDSNLQFIRVNEKFASISSVPMHEHLDRDLRDVVERPLSDILERLCRRVLAMDQPVLDHEISDSRLEDGKATRIWSVSCSPVPSSNGVIGLQLAMHDITERKHAEDALNQANRELKRANQDLEQFAFSASHDLQEPIRTVSIYSQMLKKRFGEPTGRGWRYVHRFCGRWRTTNGAACERPARVYAGVGPEYRAWRICRYERGGATCPIEFAGRHQ